MTTAQFIDEAKSLRTSDAFDIAAVHEWLKQQGVVSGNELPQVKQFSGGASNLTYHLLYPTTEKNFDLILRRPPVGHKAASAHDMWREYSVMQRLKPVFPKVPAMLAFCNDPAVVGSDFYVMERVRGIIPRGNLPKGMTLSKDEAYALSKSLIDHLVALHSVDYKAADLSDLGKGQGYVKRQVEGWSKRYQQAKTWNVPSFKKVMEWLQTNQPAVTGEHNAGNQNAAEFVGQIFAAAY